MDFIIPKGYGYLNEIDSAFLVRETLAWVPQNESIAHDDVLLLYGVAESREIYLKVGCDYFCLADNPLGGDVIMVGNAMVQASWRVSIVGSRWDTQQQPVWRKCYESRYKNRRSV